MPWFDPYMGSLLAVAAATLDRNGFLIESNAGFLRIIDVPGHQSIGTHASRFLHQPDYVTLSRASSMAGDELYRGLITLGDRSGATWSLRARVWRVDTQLRILAEYDIEELMRLNETVLQLNAGYADAQLKLAQTNLKLQQREAQILTASLTDPLTGVGNRRLLDQAVAAEINRAHRTGGTCSAIMADLDHFKKVNDRYGHEVGDSILRAFGDLLRRETRITDIIARFGGEEFVVLLPSADLQQAITIAERIRLALSEHLIAPLSDPVTVSLGAAQLGAMEDGASLLSRIDKSLYLAKQSGRNRVVADRSFDG